MSSNDPDQIRQDIERTRAELSQDVNTLADSVKPGNVAKRQASRVKDSVSGVKDKVMGSSSSAAGSAGTNLSGAGQSVGDAVSSAPGQVRSRTAGNPLAAGLAAFGIGWLAASLLPSSSQEQQAATKVKDSATPVLSDAAKDVADNLKQPAQQAATSVKETATDAAATVKDEGTSAAQNVKSDAQDARDNVADHGSSSSSTF